MLKALSCVYNVKINRGSGILVPAQDRRSADQSGPGSLRGGDVMRPTLPSNSMPGSHPEEILGTGRRTGMGSGRRSATVDSAAAFQVVVSSTRTSRFRARLSRYDRRRGRGTEDRGKIVSGDCPRTVSGGAVASALSFASERALSTAAASPCGRIRSRRRSC